MQRLLCSFLLLLLLAALTTSCNDNDSNPQVCLVTSVTDSMAGGAVHNLTLSYDQEGRLARMIDRYATTDFTYNGNTILTTIRDAVSGNIIGYDSAVCNSKGRPLYVARLIADHSLYTEYTYVYDNDSLPKTVHYALHGATQTLTNTWQYTWQNGDKIAEGKIRYFYDTELPANKEVQYLFLEDERRPYNYIPSAHLVTGSDDRTEYTYKYTLNDKGKITRVAVSQYGALYKTVVLDYDCR